MYEVRFLFDAMSGNFFLWMVVMGDKFSVPTNQPSRERHPIVKKKKRTNIYSYILIISFPVIDQFQMSESLNIQELTDNSSIIPISTESTDVQDVISVSNKDTTTTTTTTQQKQRLVSENHHHHHQLMKMTRNVLKGISIKTKVGKSPTLFIFSSIKIYRTIFD